MTTNHRTRVALQQTDSWHRLSADRDLYPADRCCVCYRPTRAGAAMLRTARTNDGEWWVISADTDLNADEWHDFQNYPGGRAPTLLPIGPDCLRQHPELRIGLVDARREVP